MMKKVWVVVANSSQAKVYRAENVQVLTEHGIFFHDESRMAARDLVSDNSGRENNTMRPGGDTYEQKTSIKLKESHNFADILANFLETGYNDGGFERLYIVAKPPFLGHLRQALTHNVSNVVESEIHKDLTQLSPKEVREYLPLVL